MQVTFSILFLLFFPGIIFSAPAPQRSSVQLKDSAVVKCNSQMKEFDCLILKRFNKPEQIRNYLDSLGYFNQQWDSISGTTTVYPGTRSVLIYETVSGFQDDSISGLPPMDLPAPYDAGKINSRAGQIARFMAQRGYPFASVAVQIEESGSRDSLFVKFIIRADQKSFFSSPVFSGETTTSRKILMNDVLFRDGDLFNINKVEQTEKMLKSRSYIADVVAGSPVIPASYKSHPDSAQRVSVPLSIIDRSGLGLDGVIGLETVRGDPQLQGNLSFSFLNLFHAGESVQFEYAGDKGRQKFNINAVKPWLFNIPVTIGVGAGMEVIKNQYGFVFGKLKFIGEIGPEWRAGIGMNVNETTPSQDSIGEYGTFYGADLILFSIPEENRAGKFSSELLIETGSGLAKKAQRYSRSHFDFSGGLHIPLLKKQALLTRLVSKHLITNEKTLLPAEMYRVGGHNSIRGYAENEYPFRTVAYGQLEYLLYFIKTGAVFIFTDGGVGFRQGIGIHSDHRFLMGYGLGVRLPSKLGSLEIGWARNYQERRGMGRIHFQIKNTLADINTKFQSGF